MTELQARLDGLKETYHGAYDWDDDETKMEVVKQAARIRNLGFRAIVITVPRQSYKAVYAEPAYFEYQTYQEQLHALSFVESDRADALKKYEKTIADIDRKAAIRQQWIDKYLADETIKKARE